MEVSVSSWIKEILWIVNEIGNIFTLKTTLESHNELLYELILEKFGLLWHISRLW